MQTDRRVVALLFLIALAVCALVTKPRVVSWNDGSRIATVDALTADGTFRIDGSPFAVGLGDKIRFHGATYSDKPPLLALCAAAVALAVAPAGVSLRHTPGTAIYLVTLFTVGVWFAVGCCCAYAFARYLGLARNVAVAVAALTGVGTLALPYATVLTTMCRAARARSPGASLPSAHATAPAGRRPWRACSSRWRTHSMPPGSCSRSPADSPSSGSSSRTTCASPGASCPPRSPPPCGTIRRCRSTRPRNKRSRSSRRLITCASSYRSWSARRGCSRSRR